MALTPDAPLPEEEALGRMIAALAHRGPDETARHRDARCGLAHTRLAIIDIASGQQPMVGPDEATWIVFNGEIFNHATLVA